MNVFRAKIFLANLRIWIDFTKNVFWNYFNFSEIEILKNLFRGVSFILENLEIRYRFSSISLDIYIYIFELKFVFRFSKYLIETRLKFDSIIYEYKE